MDFAQKKEYVRSFAALEKGWNSYNALPIYPKCIEDAIALLDKLEEWGSSPNFHAAPTGKGGVCFEWFGKKELILDLEMDKWSGYAVRDGEEVDSWGLKKPVEEEEFDFKELDEARPYVDWLVGKGELPQKEGKP